MRLDQKDNPTGTCLQINDNPNHFIITQYTIRALIQFYCGLFCIPNAFKLQLTGTCLQSIDEEHSWAPDVLWVGSREPSKSIWPQAKSAMATIWISNVYARWDSSYHMPPLPTQSNQLPTTHIIWIENWEKIVTPAYNHCKLYQWDFILSIWQIRIRGIQVQCHTIQANVCSAPFLCMKIHIISSNWLLMSVSLVSCSSEHER